MYAYMYYSKGNTAIVATIVLDTRTVAQYKNSGADNAHRRIDSN